MNTTNITPKQTSWHLRIGPILFNPDQLITKYPIITPNNPYKQVEAPALTEFGSQTAEKMLPPIAVNI